MLCLMLAVILSFQNEYREGRVALVTVKAPDSRSNDGRDRHQVEYMEEVQVTEWWFFEACYKNPKTGLHDSIYQAFSSGKMAERKLKAHQKMVRQMAKMREDYLYHCRKPGFAEEKWWDEAVPEVRRLDRLKERYFSIKGDRRAVYSSAVKMKSGILYARSPQLPGSVIPVCSR